MFQACRQSQTVPPVAVLAELREAAQVKGGGTKNAWPDEETYEAVKSALGRLREEIDDITRFSEIDTAALERSAKLAAAAVNVVQAAANVPGRGQA